MVYERTTFFRYFTPLIFGTPFVPIFLRIILKTSTAFYLSFKVEDTAKGSIRPEATF